MLGAWKKLLPEAPPEAVVTTYITLVKAARNPFFFTALAVPDTIDGRFELIVLHLFCLQQRLYKEDTEFSLLLSEEFFRDMDRAIREMGVMDTGVAKRIKRMGKAYHGRLQNYGAALADEQQLRAALSRNLYGTVKEGDVAMLERMASYVRRAVTSVDQAPREQLLSGRYAWPDPEKI